MHDLKVVPLKQEHLIEVEDLSDDPTKLLMKSPSEHLGRGSRTFGWAITRGDDVIAVVLIQVDDEHVGHLDSMVKPSERRQGFGSLLIDYALSQPELSDIIHIQASIEPDNIAAQKILEKEGFTRSGYSSEGRVEYARLNR